MFNLDRVSRKKCSIVNEAGRALVEKKVLMLESWKLIQSTMHISVTLTRTFAKKMDGMAITVTNKENVNKNFW